jgi:hypothetical protein
MGLYPTIAYQSLPRDCCRALFENCSLDPFTWASNFFCFSCLSYIYFNLFQLVKLVFELALLDLIQYCKKSWVSTLKGWSYFKHVSLRNWLILFVLISLWVFIIPFFQTEFDHIHVYFSSLFSSFIHLMSHSWFENCYLSFASMFLSFLIL